MGKMVWECQHCGQLKEYDDQFDAYYCAVCNEWAESKCKDPTCCYCPKRPDRPIEVTI